MINTTPNPLVATPQPAVSQDPHAYYIELLTKLDKNGITKTVVSGHKADVLMFMIHLKTTLDKNNDQCSKLLDSPKQKRRLYTYIKYYEDMLRGKTDNYSIMLQVILSDLTKICSYDKNTKYKPDVDYGTIVAIQDAIATELKITETDTKAFFEKESKIDEDTLKNEISGKKSDVSTSYDKEWTVTTVATTVDTITSLSNKFRNIKDDNSNEYLKFLNDPTKDERSIAEKEVFYTTRCKPYLEKFLEAIKEDVKDVKDVKDATKTLETVKDDQFLTQLTEYNNKHTDIVADLKKNKHINNTQVTTVAGVTYSEDFSDFIQKLGKFIVGKQSWTDTLPENYIKTGRRLGMWTIAIVGSPIIFTARGIHAIGQFVGSVKQLDALQPYYGDKTVRQIKYFVQELSEDFDLKTSDPFLTAAQNLSDDESSAQNLLNETKKFVENTLNVKYNEVIGSTPGTNTTNLDDIIDSFRVQSYELLKKICELRGSITIKPDDYLSKNFKLLLKTQQDKLEKDINTLTEILNRNTWDQYCKDFKTLLSDINTQIRAGKQLLPGLQCEKFLDAKKDLKSIVDGFPEFSSCIKTQYIPKIEKDIQRANSLYKFEPTDKSDKMLYKNLKEIFEVLTQNITDLKTGSLLKSSQSNKIKHIVEDQLKSFLNTYYSTTGFSPQSMKKSFVKLLTDLKDDTFLTETDFQAITTELAKKTIMDQTKLDSIKTLQSSLKDIYEKICEINGTNFDSTKPYTISELIDGIKSEISKLPKEGKTFIVPITLTSKLKLVTHEALTKFESDMKNYIKTVLKIDDWNAYCDNARKIITEISRKIDISTFIVYKKRRMFQECHDYLKNDAKHAAIIGGYKPFIYCLQQDYFTAYTYNESISPMENLQCLTYVLDQDLPNVIKYLETLKIRYPDTVKLVTSAKSMNKKDSVDRVYHKYIEFETQINELVQAWIANANLIVKAAKSDNPEFVRQTDVDNIEKVRNSIDEFILSNIYPDSDWNTYCDTIKALISQIDSQSSCITYLGKNKPNNEIVDEFISFKDCLRSNYFTTVGYQPDKTVEQNLRELIDNPNRLLPENVSNEQKDLFRTTVLKFFKLTTPEEISQFINEFKQKIGQRSINDTDKYHEIIEIHRLVKNVFTETYKYTNIDKLLKDIEAKFKEIFGIDHDQFFNLLKEDCKKKSLLEILDKSEDFKACVETEINSYSFTSDFVAEKLTELYPELLEVIEERNTQKKDATEKENLDAEIAATIGNQTVVADLVLKGYLTNKRDEMVSEQEEVKRKLIDAIKFRDMTGKMLEHDNLSDLFNKNSYEKKSIGDLHKELTSSSMFKKQDLPVYSEVQEGLAKYEIVRGTQLKNSQWKSLKTHEYISNATYDSLNSVKHNTNVTGILDAIRAALMNTYNLQTKFADCDATTDNNNTGSLFELLSLIERRMRSCVKYSNDNNLISLKALTAHETTLQTKIKTEWGFKTDVNFQNVLHDTKTLFEEIQTFSNDKNLPKLPERLIPLSEFKFDKYFAIMRQRSNTKPFYTNLQDAFVKYKDDVADTNKETKEKAILDKLGNDWQQAVPIASTYVENSRYLTELFESVNRDIANPNKPSIDDDDLKKFDVFKKELLDFYAKIPNAVVIEKKDFNTMKFADCVGLIQGGLARLNATNRTEFIAKIKQNFNADAVTESDKLISIDQKDIMPYWTEMSKQDKNDNEIFRLFKREYYQDFKKYVLTTCYSIQEAKVNYILSRFTSFSSLCHLLEFMVREPTSGTKYRGFLNVLEGDLKANQTIRVVVSGNKGDDTFTYFAELMSKRDFSTEIDQTILTQIDEIASKIVSNTSSNSFVKSRAKVIVLAYYYLFFKFDKVWSWSTVWRTFSEYEYSTFISDMNKPANIPDLVKNLTSNLVGKYKSDKTTLYDINAFPEIIRKKQTKNTTIELYSAYANQALAMVTEKLMKPTKVFGGGGKKMFTCKIIKKSPPNHKNAKTTKKNKHFSAGTSASNRTSASRR